MKEATSEVHGSRGQTTRREVLGLGAAGVTLAAVPGAAAAAASGADAPDEFTSLTIVEAGRRMMSRRISSWELTRAYLQRIERLDPRLNSYITVMAEQAIAQARERDAELMAGRVRGPLHGIPVALKDNIDTAGVRTTAASAVYASRVPDEDAPVVARLREAGAVILGKLNLHEFAYGGTCVISHHGPIRNPWNLAHTPGGSSGGSAVAVAARLCAAALGTDTAASIRYPAACCGVVGLKATHGLASIRGIVPLSEMHDHVGPLARTVEDAALVMEALVGFDPLDPVSVRAQGARLSSGIGTDISGLRIGVPRRPFFDDLDADVAAAMEAALSWLRGRVRSVTDVELPPVDTGAVLSAEIYEYHAPLLADPARRAMYHPITLERILGGEHIPATAYIETRRRMQLARQTSPTLFRDVEVLVTPTFMQPPPTIEASLASPPSELGMIRNTLPFNVYGLPTISVPCGFTRTGLPVGLQVSGPLHGETSVLAVAHAYERAHEWYQRVPRLAPT